jgi:hypothetical protein
MFRRKQSVFENNLPPTKKMTSYVSNYYVIYNILSFNDGQQKATTKKKRPDKKPLKYVQNEILLNRQ